MMQVAPSGFVSLKHGARPRGTVAPERFDVWLRQLALHKVEESCSWQSDVFPV